MGSQARKNEPPCRIGMQMEASRANHRVRFQRARDRRSAAPICGTKSGRRDKSSAECRHQAPPRAANIFGSTKLAPKSWFRAMYFTTQTKQASPSLAQSPARHYSDHSLEAQAQTQFLSFNQYQPHERWSHLLPICCNCRLYSWQFSPLSPILSPSGRRYFQAASIVQIKAFATELIPIRKSGD
jgi:hypothetical protein